MRSADATMAWGDLIGWVDEPRSEGIVGRSVRIAGWALAARGLRGVELRFEDRVVRARRGLPRADVADARPGYPDNPNAGFEIVADLRDCDAPPGVDRRTLTIVAIADDGSERTIGQRSLIEASAHERWRIADRGGVEPFFVIPALSGVAAGGALELDTWYSAYASDTTRIGMRVPILYLRTTLGGAGGYDFDAGFDTRRRIGSRAVADDALADLLAHARAARLPVLITLNGGIWSDAGGTCPQWDLTDRLEEDAVNCQWNERGEAMPDDALRDLPGSQASPELGRALTLNVFAKTVRESKKRNLQQAASAIAAFVREHSDLFVGVNLDPDVYINPFFGETQWYDYNPGTLTQFREWLAGSGAYAGEAGGVPDLSSWRRAKPLSLADVCAIARRTFRSWDEVDPPRAFPRDATQPYWDDPWVREWETFRRHLVALHYDELARWLAEAGIPSDRIWSSQGLMAPADDAMPLALAVDSPVKNHDSGGVSIEGSKPRDGHLGAIVYGAAATNEMPMEGGRSLYATLARIDPEFAIVECNTADLRHPERHPSYADAYRALRDLWNAGARLISPMAWNGSRGLDAASTGYVSFTAWRFTPFEDATLDFLLARSGLPRGSRLWTFGAGAHADSDGYCAETGAMHAAAGALELTADREGLVILVSPPEVALPRATIEAFVLGLSGTTRVEWIVVEGRAAIDAPWRPLAHARGERIEVAAAGRTVRCSANAETDDVDQLRIALALAPLAQATLRRIAVLRRRP